MVTTSAFYLLILRVADIYRALICMKWCVVQGWAVETVSPPQVPHLPGGAVGRLCRGEERLHGDQMHFAAASGGRGQSGDTRGLHHRGTGGVCV